MTKKMSTTVSEDFYDLKQDFNISWAEALRVGLAILFMERGVPEFKNPLNQDRIKFLAERAGLKVVKNGEE